METQERASHSGLIVSGGVQNKEKKKLNDYIMMLPGPQLGVWG